MGEFAASIAHELNQPLGGIVTSGDACLRWLAAKPPDLDEARQAVAAIVRDGTRASNVLVRIRGLLSRGDRQRERLHINDVIREVIALSEGELRRNAIGLETGIAENVAPVVGMAGTRRECARIERPRTSTRFGGAGNRREPLTVEWAADIDHQTGVPELIA